MTQRPLTPSPVAPALTFTLALPLDFRRSEPERRWAQAGARGLCRAARSRAQPLRARIDGTDGTDGSGSDCSDRRDGTAHEPTGFALGWDFARYRCTPPAPHTQAMAALHHGWRAGQAAFGARTLEPSRHVHTWLALRLHAWECGRSVERVQVTPNYLQQIEVSHCPITRARLNGAALPLAAADSTSTWPAPDAASIDRVRNDAGYAAGNLAVMSQHANRAKGGHGFHAAQRRAGSMLGPVDGSVDVPMDAQREAPMNAQKDASPAASAAALSHAAPTPPGAASELATLSAAQWARVAALCSLVEPLAHAHACTLPMLLLPPNRLRMFNPVQALQAFVSLQLLRPGWARRMRHFTDLLPGAALQRDFRSFFLSLLPRVLAAGKLSAKIDTRWAIEDAWHTPCVQQRWTRFARQLDAAQCEGLLARAAALGLATARIQPLTEGGATDGWNLARQGYLDAVMDAVDAVAAVAAASVANPVGRGNARA